MSEPNNAASAEKIPNIAELAQFIIPQRHIQMSDDEEEEEEKIGQVEEEEITEDDDARMNEVQENEKEPEAAERKAKKKGQSVNRLLP
jgi:hypothetical protein